jgi:hypothetical protein
MSQLCGMKNILLFAIGHSRNGDSAGFLKEGFLREVLSMIFFPRLNSLDITSSLYLLFLSLVLTGSNGFVLLIAKVILKGYLKADQALGNQFVWSFNTRKL